MSNDGERMRYRGVRKRKWGKYVAEIRSGKRSRISLGSYFTPEAAARAYDTALLCLRGPHATSFNFPDSQFNLIALEVAAEHTNPSPHVIRTAAIAVGFSFDTVRARYRKNIKARPSQDREASTHFCQDLNDQQVGETVEEEEEMCEVSDTKYLLQSPEQISFEERVQLSLPLPEEKEMMQPYDPSEIFPDLPKWDATTFEEAPAKPPT